MKKYWFFIVGSALLSLCLACQKDMDSLTTPGNFEYPDYEGRTEPIDSKINVNLGKESELADADIYLVLNTEKVYPCGGCQIIGSTIKDGNAYKIYLKEIWIPDLATAVLSYATVKFNLQTPAQGRYAIEIIIKGVKVRGTLVVTQNSHTLTFPANNHIGSVNEKIYRIPETVIWGQAESINPAVYQSFLDSLVVCGAQEQQLQPGDYYFFKIDDQGNFTINSALGLTNGQYFIYNFPGDTIIARNLVKRFAKRYADSISIYLVGGRGERFISTVLGKETW